MKIVKTILKIIGLILLVILLTTGGVILYYANYTTYELRVEDGRFGPLDTQIKADSVARSLVAQMTLDEKIEQLYGEKYLSGMLKMGVNFFLFERFPHIYAGKNDRLGIPPFVLSDGPRGARVLKKGVEGVTTFPVAMARGASWDTDLEQRVNEVIAKEIRANGANYAATPCINLLRHPGWGRAQETYGEDPWLLGKMAVAAVKGIQNHNVMACPKHYALNSIENSRFVIDIGVDERSLREVYLPHFKMAVQQGKAASIMTAYNKVRGEYMAENEYLNRTILRDEWDFDGFTTSDWFFGTYDGPASIRGGLNVEMPVQQAMDEDIIKAALINNELAEDEIDEVIIENLRTRLPYAVQPDIMDYNEQIIASPSHTELAREVAEKSMVLLKNEDVLPFSNIQNEKIGVFGELADREITGDHGSSDSRPLYVVSPFEGISSYATAKGAEVLLYDEISPSEAAEVADELDKIILVVGYTYEDEGEYMQTRNHMMESAKAGKLVGEKVEGGDRLNLDLRLTDIKMINALAATGKEFVVVYVGGSAITMSEWIDQVPALLFSWYSGMEGGNALANILFGKVSPSGKLPFSIARNESDYPIFTPFALEIDYGYYHGYTLFDKKDIDTLFPFGFGLSYTDFQYDSLKVSIDSTGVINASFLVSNIGKRAGEEVVQLYIGFENSSVDRPLKLLRGFEKISLDAGESKRMDLIVGPDDLRWYNTERKRWQLEKMEYSVFVGPSSDFSQLLRSSVTIQ